MEKVIFNQLCDSLLRHYLPEATIDRAFTILMESGYGKLFSYSHLCTLHDQAKEIRSF